MARQLLGFALLLVLGVVVERTLADEPERIFGGTDAAPTEFPYQISFSSKSKGHVCGGALITNQHVLTAAHCVHGEKAEDFEIVTGSVLRYGGESHSIKNIRMHPEFIYDKAASLKNDIAVITLEKPIAENKNQKPIALATSEPAEGTPLTVTGWGYKTLKGPGSPMLQKASVFLIGAKLCRSIINDKQPLYDTHVCAGSLQGIGTCAGDSGGPLVYKKQLVGVVSWGFPCATGVPDVYTKVSKYQDFIKESIALN